MHVSADIGCHTFATLPPFNVGNTVLGYGLGLASSAAIRPHMGRRTVSIMGDGGFWHNGLSTGVAGAVYNGVRRRAHHHEQRVYVRHRGPGDPVDTRGYGHRAGCGRRQRVRRIGDRSEPGRSRPPCAASE